VILVSACLAGIRCRYDGDSALDERVVELVKKGEALPLCPEQLGGLTTPRSPCQLKGDAELVWIGKLRIFDQEGRDRTDAFLLGAREVLRVMNYYNIQEAILKEKSPSCGRNGVTAYLLKKSGIKVTWLP